MPKQVTVGLWEIAYPSDDVVRVLIGGMHGETILVSIDAETVVAFLESLESDAPLVVDAVAMKPQELIEDEDQYDDVYDEPFERFNYNLSDDDLSGFMMAEAESYELLFPEARDREWFSQMIWEDYLVDALMWKAAFASE